MTHKHKAKDCSEPWYSNWRYSEHFGSDVLKQFSFELKLILKAIPRLVGVEWCSLRWAAITLSRVKSQIYESLIRKSHLGFPCWRARASAAAFPKQGSPCIWTHVISWLSHLCLPREERDGDTGGFHFVPLNFIFFPKRGCGCVWASLASLPTEMCPALHFLPKSPSLGMHLRFGDPMVLAVYGLGHLFPEPIIPLDKVAIRHVGR